MSLKPWMKSSVPAVVALIVPLATVAATTRSGPADEVMPFPAQAPADRSQAASVVGRPTVTSSQPSVPVRQPPVESLASRPGDPVEAAIAASRNPVPWLKWGADLRLRELYINNGVRLNKADPDHEIHRQRYRPRFWTTVSPHAIVDFNMRLIWEANGYCKPDSYDGWDPGEVFFDIFNFAMKKPGGLPFTVTGGRQEIALGDRWLVFEGNPLDGSRSIFFDAVRGTTELESIQTRIEMIYLETDAEGEGWMDMLKSRDFSATTGLPGRRYMTEQDERGAILWIENKSLRCTEIDGYFIYKHNDRTLATGSDADIYTFGLRAVHDVDEHWQIRGDLAGQFGRRNDAGLCAMGSNNRLRYDFKDRFGHSLRMDYEYLSGDRPGSGTDEAFDLLWGRWPRFSELYIYTNAGETGRIGDCTNMHRLAWGHSWQPLENLEMSTDYHLLFADQNTWRDRPAFSGSGRFRGQLFTWVLKYRFNAHMTGHLWTEYFFPGDYFSNANNDPAVFLRAEIMLTY